MLVFVLSTRSESSINGIFLTYWLSQMKGFARRKPSVSRVACRRLQEKINFLVRVAAGTIM